MKVLRHLQQDWLEMVDTTASHKPFFYNRRTKQIALEPPVELPALRVAEGQPPKVLRQLPGMWLECEDSRGIFYYNPATKVATLESPPETIEQRDALSDCNVPAPPRVLRSLGRWLELNKDGEVFYFDTVTGLVSLDPPPEATNGEPVLASLPEDAIGEVDAPSETRPPQSTTGREMQTSPHKEQQQQQQQQLQQNLPKQPQQSEQHNQHEPEACVKLKLGDYAVCEDSKGEFYVHLPTAEEFEEPPEELLLLVMQLKVQEQERATAVPASQQGSCKPPVSPKLSTPLRSSQKASSTSPVKVKSPGSKQVSLRPSGRSGYHMP